MRKFLGSLCFLAMFTVKVLAGDSTNSNWASSFTFKSVWASKYLAFGTGGLIYDKPMVQSDLFVCFNNGFYADAWTSVPFLGFDKNFGTEIDLGIGWSGPLSKLGLGGKVADIALDIGACYYDEPHLATLGANDVFNSHIKLTKAFKPLSVFASWNNYLTMPGSFFEGGDELALGVSKSKSCFSDKLTLSASFATVYDSGGFGLDNGLLWKGIAAAEYKLSRHLSAHLQVTGYIPATVHDSRETDKVIFAGMSWAF